MLQKTPLELSKPVRSTIPTLEENEILTCALPTTPEIPLIEIEAEARKATTPQLTRTLPSQISTRSEERRVGKERKLVRSVQQLKKTRREVQLRLAKTLRSTNPTLKQN